MSGETVRHWKMRMLDWARPPAMADDQALWDQFLAQFRAEYADTQRGDRARETIDNIKMKGIAIDQYISDFVRLAEDAQYDLGATGTWRFFLRGLPECCETGSTRARAEQAGGGGILESNARQKVATRTCTLYE